MGIVKHAQFVVVECKVAPQRISRTAMLRDARRHEFTYTPKPGFLYVRSRAISSRTNDNFDTYPAEELRTAYRSFVGKPVFVNHNNDDPRRGRGVILDAVLHENVAPDGSPDTWVEVLMEVDAQRFPRLAKAILDGDIDRTSMGCNVMSSECSYCGKVASTPDQYCEHINNQKGRRLRRRAAMGGTESVLVHEICRGLSFFENSLLVDEPADPTAYFTGIDDSGLRMGKAAALKLAEKKRWERDGFYWVAHTNVPGTEPEAAQMYGPTFPTVDEAKQFASQFPASWGIFGSPLSTFDDTGNVNVGSVGVKGFWFAANRANKGINESAVKRLRTVINGLTSRGFAPVYEVRAGNAYATEQEFWAALDAYSGKEAKVAAFKLAATDDLAGLNGKVIQYRKVGTFRVIGPVEGEVGYTDARGGWYWCEPIKAPKKYRDEAAATGGRMRLYVMDIDVIDKEASVPRTAKDVLEGGLDHGPTEPGPNAATRWEGVVSEGQGYRVLVLWREHADALAQMLSGVFKDYERAEEWAQKCRDAGALRVSIQAPRSGSKTAAGQYMVMGPDHRLGTVDGNTYGWVTLDDGESLTYLRYGGPRFADDYLPYWYFQRSNGQEVHWEGVDLPEWLVRSGGVSFSMKQADYDDVHRGHPIETLRNQTCPVCKTQNSWDGSICTVCGYVLPPKPFRAPDTDVTSRVSPDEGWFDPDAKKAEPFDPVSDRDTAMKGQKDQGDSTMAQSIAAAARQRLAAQQALANQRRAGMPPRRRYAAEDGGGQINGDPVPSAEAPSETTEGAIALPDAQAVPVDTPGGTGVDGTEPDATATVTDVGGEIPAPAPMDVVDVEAPVAGATDVDPEAASDERPNINNAAEGADGTPLNASDWNTAARRFAQREMENIRTAVRDRIFSALRLAKLRIAVGVAEHHDELALARDIENGSLSTESIANEIKALGLVYARQRQGSSMPSAPHQRSARRSPSMAGGTAPLQSLAAGAGGDDEALFEP
jgi:hypothetical protein